MNSGKTIFSQLIEFVPSAEFRHCVERYNGSYKLKSFSCWDQFLCMAFAQLTYRESLRDIEACLRAAGGKLYHMGIRAKVSRNTLANANAVRDWRIYADFAQALIATARQLYADDSFGIDLQQSVYALDTTMVDLCLSLFPWASYQKRKRAIKMHTVLDLRGNIPSFILITHGKISDLYLLDHLAFEAGAFYIMDRGYLDFRRLHKINLASAFFVTRARRDFAFNRVHSLEVDKSTGVLSDQIITLTTYVPRKGYPERLRRIRFLDAKRDKHLVFLTNNFALPADTVAQLYRCRWQIELFFKWIKQHLRIKAFYGTTANALKTQIWIAITVYVLVATIKKRLDVKASLYQMLQIVSVSIFEKTPLLQAFSTIESPDPDSVVRNQLNLFN